MERPESNIIPQGVKHYPHRVASFDPSNNAVQTADGLDLTYDYLVVAPGLETNFAGIGGLSEALADPEARVSSIYSGRTAEKAWRDIQGLKRGRAIFTQPAGVIKCAGAPQKVMWMALSQWAREGVRGNIDATFATGGPGKSHVPWIFFFFFVLTRCSHVRRAQVQPGPRRPEEGAERRGAVPAQPRLRGPQGQGRHVQEPGRGQQGGSARVRPPARRPAAEAVGLGRQVAPR